MKPWLTRHYWKLMNVLHGPFRRNNFGPEFRAILPEFVSLVREMEAPVILELGSRNVTGFNPREHFPFAGRYIGCDVHPGPNVDVVADVHDLSSVVPAASVDAVVSFSVFEHLLFPWKVAMEINRVLKPGGLVYIATHPVWPSHEMPWDFWRFPVAGLVYLFGDALGFRVLNAAEGVPCKIYALEKGPEFAGFVQAHVYAGVAIVAQKVADYDAGRFRWDVDVKALLDTEYPPSA